MKRLLTFLLFLTVAVSSLNAQKKGANGDDVIAQRMTNYIRTELNMTDAEGAKFSSIFLQYLKEFKQTHAENKEDKLVLQQKIAELRISYRSKFKVFLSEDKADKVFKLEDNFRKTILKAIKENKKEKTRKLKGSRSTAF